MPVSFLGHVPFRACYSISWINHVLSVCTLPCLIWCTWITYMQSLPHWPLPAQSTWSVIKMIKVISNHVVPPWCVRVCVCVCVKCQIALLLIITDGQFTNKIKISCLRDEFPNRKSQNLSYLNHVPGSESLRCRKTSCHDDLAPERLRKTDIPPAVSATRSGD